MKILYIHQYFRTPEEGGCTRSYHLAKGLVDHGHEVEMITAHYGDYQIKEIEGLTVRYLPILYKNQFGFLKRVWAFWKFVRLAKKEATKIQNVDLAYVMTTPLTTGLIALYLKEKRNIPYYFEVGDLWPEAPIQMGAVKNPIFKWLLYRFEKKCYFEAQKVIALSPDIRNYIERVSPVTKVHILPNISHCSYYEQQIRINTFDGKTPFRIGYIGTLGRANNLEYLLDVARASLNLKLPIAFHIMGEGMEEKSLKAKARILSNVSFQPHGSKGQVKDVLETMDAVYISFKNLPVLATGSPNKFFDGLAAGKLIIINFEGWIKDVVEKNGCGFYHSPTKPKQFLRKIEPYLKNHEVLLNAQRNSRKLAEEFYDCELLVQKLLKILNNEKSITIDDSEIYVLTA